MIEVKKLPEEVKICDCKACIGEPSWADAAGPKTRYGCDNCHTSFCGSCGICKKHHSFHFDHKFKHGGYHGD